MVKLLEVLIIISLLKGAYYDAAAGIVPAAVDLLICLAVMVFEIERGIKENDRSRKERTFGNVYKR